MRARVAGGLGEPLDDVGRRADLRVAAPEVERRLASGRARGGDACEQRREVLLGQPLEPSRAGAHRRMVRPRAPLDGQL